MARDLPVWLEPRITDMSHEPFVVARARMGGFAVARTRSRADKVRIGRKAGKAGSFSRWGWGEMGLITRPAVSHLGYLVLEFMAARSGGIQRQQLDANHGGPITHGGVYAVTRILQRDRLIVTSSAKRFSPYFLTEKGLDVLRKTRKIIAEEAQS